MKLRISVFRDAFLGSGVPLGGDPITAFQIVPLLELRTATVLDNCQPMVRDLVKVRFVATNCGAREIDIVRCVEPGQGRDQEDLERNAIALLPGESLEFNVFRSWDAPGTRHLTLGYEARVAGYPFARLTYPTVDIHVRAPLTPYGFARFIHNPSKQAAYPRITRNVCGPKDVPGK